MKNIFQIFLLFLVFTACQSRPTVVKIDGVSEAHRYNYAQPPVWNSSMQTIKQHLVNLEPYIFDRTEFAHLNNRKFISKEIHNMAAASKNVKHDPALYSKDPTVKFVAEQFSEEVQNADQNFSEGRIEYTRWQLMKVTKYCLECHTRTREGTDLRSASANPSYIKTLPPPDQMEVMIAFRQFEPAFEFAVENLSKNKLSTNGVLNADRLSRMGLLVAVQYMQDRERALRLVETISQNPKLSTSLIEASHLWKKSLDQWNPNERLDTMESFRKISKSTLSEIEAMRLIPSLLRYLDNTSSSEELAETLFLIGDSYDHLSKISLLSLPEKYFELCITKAPKSKWAPKCYDRYEELITLGFTGTSGVHVPKKVRDHLNELRQMTK